MTEDLEKHDSGCGKNTHQALKFSNLWEIHFSHLFYEIQ